MTKWSGLGDSTELCRVGLSHQPCQPEASLPRPTSSSHGPPPTVVSPPHLAPELRPRTGEEERRERATSEPNNPNREELDPCGRRTRPHNGVPLQGTDPRNPNPLAPGSCHPTHAHAASPASLQDPSKLSAYRDRRFQSNLDLPLNTESVHNHVIELL
jgi:hypothetical protein